MLAETEIDNGSPISAKPIFWPKPITDTIPKVFRSYSQFFFIYVSKLYIQLLQLHLQCNIYVIFQFVYLVNTFIIINYICNILDINFKNTKTIFTIIFIIQPYSFYLYYRIIQGSFPFKAQLTTNLSRLAPSFQLKIPRGSY